MVPAFGPLPQARLPPPGYIGEVQAVNVRIRDLAGLFLVEVAVLALRGEIGYVLYGPTLLLLAAWAAWIAAGLHLAGTAWAPSPLDSAGLLRAVWISPLALMVTNGLVLGVVLLLPGLSPSLPPWTEVLGLTGPRIAPLLFGAFAALVVGVGMDAVRRIASFVAATLSGAPPPPRDPWTFRAVAGLAVLLILLVGGILHARGGPMGHLRAWATLRFQGAEDSLAVLRELAEGDPDHPLMDSVLYRMARLHDEELGEPRRARALYRKLLAQHPGSPWCDDATYALARLELVSGGDRAAGLDLLRRFAATYPRSPLRGEAALALAEAHRSAGDLAAARATLEVARGSDAIVWSPEDYPATLAPVARVATRRLATLDAGGTR